MSDLVKLELNIQAITTHSVPRGRSTTLNILGINMTLRRTDRASRKANSKRTICTIRRLSREYEKSAKRLKNNLGR